MSVPTFAWAMEQGVRLGLTSSERLVLLYLADKANGERVCWPGQETIVRYTALSLRTVRMVIPALAGHGLISVESRPGIVTRYHILRPDTPADGHGVNGGNPGRPTRSNSHKVIHSPGNTAQGTPANGHRAPRQTSTTNPGKSCTGPRQNLHATPANQHPEPLREPRREPKTRVPAREEGADLNSSNISKRPVVGSVQTYASPDEAREAFAAFLAAKRAQRDGLEAAEPPPEPKAAPHRVQQAAAAVIYSLKKYAAAEGVKAQRTPLQQAVEVLHGEVLPPGRHHYAEPVRTLEQQQAELARMIAEEAAAKAGLEPVA